MAPMWKLLQAASAALVVFESWWPGNHQTVAPVSQQKTKTPMPAIPVVPESYGNVQDTGEQSRQIKVSGADENNQAKPGIGTVPESKPPDMGNTGQGNLQDTEKKPVSSSVEPEKTPTEKEKEAPPKQTVDDKAESIKEKEAPKKTDDDKAESIREKEAPKKTDDDKAESIKEKEAPPKKTDDDKAESVKAPSAGSDKEEASKAPEQPEKVRKPIELLSATPLNTETVPSESHALSEIPFTPQILVPAEQKAEPAKKVEEGLDQLNIHKGAIIHLFEWKWQDIAKECEEFLAPRGFEAIQISPPTENLRVPGRPWWERYQIVSYKLESRSGTRAQLQDMLNRCNKVGIKVFADVVFNHMTGDAKECRGVAGSTCNPQERDYPAIPYTKDDFHYPVCQINDMQNATEVRVCEMFFLHDLDQGKPNVRDRVVTLMNELIDMGVAGFRINAAKNMYAGELYLIYSRLNNLNVKHGLPERTKPMVFQDVHDLGGEGVKYEEYVPLALITDVRYGLKMSEYFKHKKTGLKWLQHLDKDSYLTPDLLSLVFVDNHNTERNTGYINYKQSRAYKMAIAFMLAYGYGYPFILSGYKFGDDYNQGPPMEEGGENILSPQPNKDNLCNEKWVCQHRWRQIYTMVQFNRAAYGNKVTSWWDNGYSQIAFSRGNAAFVAFNLERKPMDVTIPTDLPQGKYCDVISGAHVGGGKCENGRQPVSVTRVGLGGRNVIRVRIEAYNEKDQGSDGVFAIFDHKISKI